MGKKILRTSRKPTQRGSCETYQNKPGKEPNPQEGLTRRKGVESPKEGKESEQNLRGKEDVEEAIIRRRFEYFWLYIGLFCALLPNIILGN